MRSKNPLLPCLLFYSALFFLSGCNFGVPYWPPAVQSKADIEKLPTTQRDIRGIGIGDQELQLIAERFHDLDYLFLSPTSTVSDFGISKLSESTKLYQIVIEDGGRLSDQSISVLATLPSLRELIITNAPRFTDSSIAVLAKNQNLKLLYLFKCPQFSPSAKATLQASIPKCKILF